MHLSSLKARWHKQGVSHSSSKKMLSTTMDGQSVVTRSHSGMGAGKVPSGGGDNLNLSFSALNQTAKKWADRRQAREKSQELANTSNPALLRSPVGRGGAGHEEATEPPHKHHLSMTGFVGGGMAKGTGSMHSGGASGSGIPRREHGKTLEDIKKKLQMMKQMHSNLNTE